MPRSLLRFALLAAVLAASTSLGHAQSPPSPDAASAASALHAAEQAHLWRVAAWGGANTVGGLALMWGTARSERRARWHFGAMSAGWGLVNVGIATAGLLAGAPPPPEPAAVLDAERQFHDILLFNLGLNVAYSAVGGTMLAAGYRDVSSAARWRGFGTALILQGAGLLVLDGIAFFASRTRLTGLLDAGVTVSAHPLPTGLALTVSL